MIICSHDKISRSFLFPIETLAGLDEVTKELDKVQSEIDRLLQHQQWLVERKKELESTANRLQAECQKERPDVTKSGKKQLDNHWYR